MAIWTARSPGAMPKTAADDVRLLLKYADQLTSFIEHSKNHRPALTATDIVASIAKETLVDSSDLEGVFNALENIKNLSDEFGGVDKTIDFISRSLSEDTAKDVLAKKEQISAAVLAYSEDNAVAISYKAHRLTYLRENIYQEAEIITDARPVFDSKGENIIEYLITHTLIASYFHRGRFENIHLAMDAGDVIKLRRACDRAFIKAKSLKSALGEKARILRDEDED
jgi:hypothetical protein